MFAAHWLAYCGMMALGYAPIAILTGGLAAKIIPEMEGAYTFAGALAVFIVIAALAFCLLLAPAAISFGVAQDISGRGFSFGQSVRVALRRSPAILALTLLIGLWPIRAGSFDRSRTDRLHNLCRGDPRLHDRRPRAIQGHVPQRLLTKGNRWRVFGILCVLYLGGAMVEQLVKFILERLTSDIAALAISLTFDILVGAISAVALGALYAQLRIAREGVDIAHIAEVFN